MIPVAYTRRVILIAFFMVRVELGSDGALCHLTELVRYAMCGVFPTVGKFDVSNSYMGNWWEFS